MASPMKSAAMTAPIALTRAERFQLFLRSCMSSPLNVVVTSVVVAISVWTVFSLSQWLFTDAVWSGTSGADCEGHDGACWIFLRARADQILYGTYPASERWRLGAAALLGISAFASFATFRPWSHLRATALLLVSVSVAAGVLMYGGVFGLPVVPTNRWGGAMLTIVIAAWTIVTALPLGLLLALARRSKLPIVSSLAAGFIDLVRSLPLVGILFLMIVMFPLFVPPGVETDKLVRALAAFTVFNAANFAEVFRGGLQAVPRGQIEAGGAIGLPKWRITTLIIMPQAISISVPGLVNLCIAVVKETTIVLIIGMFDFIGVLQGGLSDPNWLMAQSIRTTSYVFAAGVFWIVCFALSRFSMALERRTVLSTSGA
jgi:general L-amino acid transport system permease protein